MKFVSEAQRKAVFAQLRAAQRYAKRTTAPVRKFIRGAEQQFHRLPVPAQRAIQIGGTLAAGALALHPRITHVEVPFGTSKALHTKIFLKKWGPHLAAYTAAPVLGLIAAKRAQGQSIGKTFKKNKKQLLGAGAVGLGGLLGERAIFHSLVSVVPHIKLPPEITAHGFSRLGWVAGHGVPLGVASTGITAFGKGLLPYKKRAKTFAQQKKLVLKGFGARLASESVEHFLPGSALALKPVKAAFSAVSIGAIPSTVSFKLGKWFGTKKKSSHR